MGRLVRIHNGEVLVAHNFVATPEYTLYVADYAGGATPPHGWEYFEDDVDVDDFAPLWAQPADATTAYALGAIVMHNGTRWLSLIVGNVWEPGISGWRAAHLVAPDGTVTIPAWIQPTGAHDAYALGARVTHNGQAWESTIAGNIWAPGVYGWVAA